MSFIATSALDSSLFPRDATKNAFVIEQKCYYGMRIVTTLDTTFFFFLLMSPTLT